MECHICALVCKGNGGLPTLERSGTLETRVKEHRNASQKGALEKSALAEHAWMNYHSMKWEEVSVNEQAKTAKKY